MSMLTLDPRELGERLRIARTEVSLTQEEAAKAIGMARTTLVAIERGQRAVRPDELIALAALYRVTVARLASPDAIHVDLAAKFRRIEGKEASKAVADAVSLLNRLATGAVQLERVVGQSSQMDYPPPIKLSPTMVVEQAEDAALSLRSRLGVGLGPIPDVISLLESELGLRIFFRPLSSGHISGLYAFDPAIGACILINANHNRKRRVQTAVHETGHLISDRSHADVLEEDEVPLSVEERFARRFGSAFLMPAPTVRSRFEQIAGAERRFELRQLILMAHQIGVATEAMCRRMEELGLLPQGTWNSLKDRGFAGELERLVLGESSLEHKPPLVPVRLAYLASIAREQELLSEGQLCDLLVVDRLELREALLPFEAEETLSAHG
jgi:Zn-dependent peptidase ImmA (M78 family)/DNA-binding XRE family transcriptional regulator